METRLEIKFSGNYSYFAKASLSEYLSELRAAERMVKKAYNSINMANPVTCDAVPQDHPRRLPRGEEGRRLSLGSQTTLVRRDVRGAVRLSRMFGRG